MCTYVYTYIKIKNELPPRANRQERRGPLRKCRQGARLPSRKEDLHCVDFLLFIPPGVMPRIISVYLHVGDLKSYGFVGLGSEQQELVIPIWRRLYALLKGRHEPVIGLCSFDDLWIFHFAKKRKLPRPFIPELRYAIPRPSNAHALSRATRAGGCLKWHRRDHRICLLLRQTSGEVRLMFLPLCVREIRPLIGVERKT